MTDAPRKRRWPWYLAALAVLLVLGAWWINRQLEPNRLTATVLERVGSTLGLELSIDGTPEYALRPEPRLVLPNLDVRQPGATTPLLSAERAEVSLPWDTITGGDSLVITRIELLQPVLDLEALAAWQATRPDAPFELPTLTEGLRVTGGRIVGDGWRVSGLSLSVPLLRPEAELDAEAEGRIEIDSTRVDFKATVNVASAGLASGLALRSRGRIASGELDVPYELDWRGSFDAAGETSLLTFDQLALASESPFPDLTATGRAELGAKTLLSLRGEIPRWPEGWPALPDPLAASPSPLAFTLDYAGANDLSAPLRLQLGRDDTELSSAFVLPELLAWLDSERVNPLPPLQGTLATPSLVVAGATLEGVRIEFEPEDATTGEPSP